MVPLAWGLAQAGGSDPPGGLLIALAVLFAIVALLAVRGLVDWLFGSKSETVTYRLADTGDGLALADPDARGIAALVGLSDPAMQALLDRVESRNEMRLHTVVEADGEERDWEVWRANPHRQTPRGVVIEDSKGIVEIDRSGRVTATPPLDEAVRGDLLEVLESALAGH